MLTLRSQVNLDKCIWQRGSILNVLIRSWQTLISTCHSTFLPQGHGFLDNGIMQQFPHTWCITLFENRSKCQGTYLFLVVCCRYPARVPHRWFPRSASKPLSGKNFFCISNYDCAVLCGLDYMAKPKPHCRCVNVVGMNTPAQCFKQSINDHRR